MKTVFSNHSEVAHVWAQRVQDEGKAGNVFFFGDSIFSYGSHFTIARFVDSKRGEVVLFTTRSYSVSTSSHKSLTRSALGYGDNQRCTIFDVPYVNAISATDHKRNLESLVSVTRADIATASRAKGSHGEYGRKPCQDLDRAPKLHSQALDYRKAFVTWRECGAKLRRELETMATPTDEETAAMVRNLANWERADRFRRENPEEYEAKLNKARAQRARTERRKRSRAIRRAIEAGDKYGLDRLLSWGARQSSGAKALLGKMEATRQVARELAAIEHERAKQERAKLQRVALRRWIKGENVSPPFGLRVALLRIKSNRVETTMGARVSTKAAQALCRAIDAGKNIAGWKIDRYYTVRELTAKALIVGCHRIPRSEVRRICRALEVSPC